MSGTLALASAIAAMDQETLTSLVLQRRPQAAAGVSDPIGLASELLRSDAVSRALAPPRTTRSATLLSLGGAVDLEPAPNLIAELTRLGLVGLDNGNSTPLPEITLAVQSGLNAAGVSPSELTATAAAENPDDAGPDTSTWYAAAVTSVGQSAEILRHLVDRPGRLNRNGSIAVATIRLLAESSSVEVTEATLALRALERAELVSTSKASQLLLSTVATSQWLAKSYGERWIDLANATMLAMPAPLLGTLGIAGTDLASAVAALPIQFPLLPPAELTAAAEFMKATEHLGLTVEGMLSAPARALLAGDHEAAGVALERDLPAVTSGIYVQPDLSIVVPGPLSPSDEAEVAALSRPEHIGIATTRRVTEASLADAIERGATADSTRGVFTRLSLTGIPQPLDYLLTSLADRGGTIVVAPFSSMIAGPEITCPAGSASRA